MKRILLLAVTAFFGQNLIGQTQVGSNIGGLTNSNFGYSVAISSDGTKLIGGAPNNTGTASASQGLSTIYEYGTSWTGMINLTGETAGDNAGNVAMSDNGLVVAIGAALNDGNGADSGHVRVYAWNGSAWVQRGADINGEAAGDRSGFVCSLSSDGSVIAIGAYLNDGAGADAGHVRVYFWNGSAWVQRGTDLNGDAAGDNFGISIALNSTGTKLIVGASGNDSAGTNAGRIKTYNWNGTSWVQYGGTINGAIAGAQFGRCVSISEDGTKIAVGAPTEDNGVSSSVGSVSIYSGTTWAIVNSKVYGSSVGGYFGMCVNISGAGDAFFASQGVSGTAKYYKNNGTAWGQVGSTITGLWQNSGSSVALSKNGTKAVISSTFGGSPALKVYDFTAALSTNDFTLNNKFNLFPNPANDSFEITSEFEIEKVEIYSLQGQIIKSVENQKTITISELPTGIYSLIIYSEEGKGTKKLIKN